MVSAIKEINCYKRVIREGNLDKGLFEEVMFEMRPEGRQLCEKWEELKLGKGEVWCDENQEKNASKRAWSIIVIVFFSLKRWLKKTI